MKQIEISTAVYIVFMVLAFLLGTLAYSQEKDIKKELEKTFKFSTFYAAVNGGTSISDQNVYSVASGLQTDVVKTPFDYSISLG